jgi:hypothetical protein
MTEYNFFADLLNKYSQLTPWVQVITMFSVCAVVVASIYFTKESIAIIAKSLRSNPRNTGGDNE